MNSVGSDFSYGSEDNSESFEVRSEDTELELLLSEVEESSEEEYVLPGGEVSNSPLAPKMESEEIETSNKTLSKRDEAIKLNKRNSMIGMGILIGVVIVTSVVLSVATFGGLGVVLGAIAFTLLAFGGADFLINNVFGPQQVPEEDNEADDSVQDVEKESIEELSEMESSSSEESYLVRSQRVKVEENEDEDEDFSSREEMIPRFQVSDKGKEEDLGVGLNNELRPDDNRDKLRGFHLKIDQWINRGIDDEQADEIKKETIKASYQETIIIMRELQEEYDWTNNLVNSIIESHPDYIP